MEHGRNTKPHRFILTTPTDTYLYRMNRENPISHGIISWGVAGMDKSLITLAALVIPLLSF